MLGSSGPRQWNVLASRWTGLLLAAPLLLLTAVFVAVPIGQLLVESVAVEPGPAAYGEFFSDGASKRALYITVVVSLAVAVATTVVGAVIAWSLRTSERRVWRMFLWAALLIPLWMGVVVKNYSFGIILGRNGVLNQILEGFFGIGPYATSLMYTNWAVLLGISYSMIPFATLPMYVSFRAIDLDLVRASKSLGASTFASMRTIVLPLVKPGLAASFTIVFLVSIGFYVTPLLLGGPASPFVATLVNQDIFKYFNEAHARVSSVVLLAVAAIVLTAVSRMLRINLHRIGTGDR